MKCSHSNLLESQIIAFVWCSTSVQNECIRKYKLCWHIGRCRNTGMKIHVFLTLDCQFVHTHIQPELSQQILETLPKPVKFEENKLAAAKVTA